MTGILGAVLWSSNEALGRVTSFGLLGGSAFNVILALAVGAPLAAMGDGAQVRFD
ncbi:MAG: hypothetical protein AB8I08_32660 [Sandaracinaceae bacterium]